MDEQPTFPPPPLSAEAAESLERGIEWMEEHPVAAEIRLQERRRRVREAERYLRRKRRGRKCEQPEGVDKYDLMIAGYRVRDRESRWNRRWKVVERVVYVVGFLASLVTIVKFGADAVSTVAGFLSVIA